MKANAAFLAFAGSGGNLNLNTVVDLLAGSVLLGRAWAVLIVLSFGIPWVYPEDYGNSVSLYGFLVIVGSDFAGAGDHLGLLASLLVFAFGAWYLYSKLVDDKYGVAAVFCLAITLVALAIIVLVFGSADRLDWGWFFTVLLCMPHCLHFLVGQLVGASSLRGGASGVVARFKKFCTP